MCHAHHILHWILGGETKLENLVLLCGYHHRVIHDTPWQVRLNPRDHKPEFRPPSKPDVESTWIRYRPRRE
jgi:HNH endonuclease